MNRGMRPWIAGWVRLAVACALVLSCAPLADAQGDARLLSMLRSLPERIPFPADAAQAKSAVATRSEKIHPLLLALSDDVADKGPSSVVAVGRGVSGRHERRPGGGGAVCGGPRRTGGAGVACRGRRGRRHGDVGQRRVCESAPRPHRGVRGRGEPVLHDGPGAVLLSPARRRRGFPARGARRGCGRSVFSGCTRPASRGGA